MSPLEAVKTKIFNNKNKKEEFKVNEKRGIGFDYQRINLNFIKINSTKLRKMSEQV